MALVGNEFVIDDNNAHLFVAPPVINGEQKGMGLVRRDLDTHPVGSYRGLPEWDANIPLIPRIEWPERIKDMEGTKSRLSDVRMRGNFGQPIPALDQDGQGYCWMYDPVMGLMIVRAAMHEPYVRLSAHACACKIMNFQDKGGWAAQGVQFLIENGCPSVDFWPEKSMSRQYDTPETWENAKLHRITEGWMEISSPVYDRNLSFDQLATGLLSRRPGTADYYWMGHSMCVLDLVEIDASRDLQDPDRWGTRDLNSWTDGWGDKGFVIIKGNKAIPNGATIIGFATPSIN